MAIPIARGFAPLSPGSATRFAWTSYTIEMEIEMGLPLRSVVAMAYVRSVPDSIEFYRKLGFEVGDIFPEEGSEPTWAWLASDRAQLMISRASEPVIASEQGVLFYIYCDDVLAKRKELENAGLSVGPVQYPFYCPKGEFRIEDPDGYVLMIAHT